MSTEVRQAIPDVNTAQDIANLYDIRGVAPGDFVTRKATSNGQVITSLCVSPLTEDTVSTIALAKTMQMPCAIEVEASMSQRVRHDFAALDLYDDDTAARPLPDDISIASLYQSNSDNGAAYSAVAGTILTIVLSSPFQGFLSDWIHVYGLVDNRLNYPNLCVKYISYDRKTLTCGFSDEAALPSLAVSTITPPAGSAKIRHYHNLGGARHGASIRYTSSTATSAALVTQFGGNDVAVSGTLNGDHRVTVGTSVPIYNGAVRAQSEIKATSRYRIEVRPGNVAFMDLAGDTNGNWTTRAIRSAVKPDYQASLSPRLRACCPKSMTRPVAKIVSISKSGTTTATVTTDGAHGRASNEWVTIKGVRDQTNFANISTPVQITVTDATHFTLVLGSAVTATSYGGSVILTNGGIDQQGILGQIIQSATVDATTGVLTLVGSGSWSTGVGVMNIGDYVQLHGLRDNTTGADLGLDGAWEVAYVSTTSLELIPIYDIAGTRVSPAITTLTLTNCGGSVLHRTTARVHDVVGETWGEHKAMIDGAGTDRADKALPVRVLNTTTVSVSGNPAVVGAAAHDAAVSGAPARISGRAITANYTPVQTGDVADLITTLLGALIQKPFSIPEADFQAIDSITNSTTAVQLKAALASNQNYLTGLAISSETLGSSGDIQIRSTPVATPSATIASNTLVTSAAYGWKVGDLIYVTASGVTGLSAGSYYYVLTVSGTSLTFSATRGGSTLVISGTSVTATIAKVLWRHKLLTTALPVASLQFPNPVSGGVGLAIEACTPTALTSGRVDLNAYGYQAP